MEKIDILSEVSNAKEVIDNCTLESILDKSDSRYILSQKIANMAQMLYLNAIRIAQGNSSLLNTANNKLSLEDIKTLMAEVRNILLKPLFSEEIEENIKNLLQTYSLNLEEIWQENPSDEIERTKIQNILTGN